MFLSDGNIDMRCRMTARSTTRWLFRSQLLLANALVHKRSLNYFLPITSSRESEEKTSLGELGLDCKIASNRVFTINWHRQECSRLTVPST